MFCLPCIYKKYFSIFKSKIKTYIVSGADINLSPCVRFAASLAISLCLGLLSKLAYLSSRSSLLTSCISGILAPGINVNAVNDSFGIDRTFLGLNDPIIADVSPLS